jgi:hypothetical protein
MEEKFKGPLINKRRMNANETNCCHIKQLFILKNKIKSAPNPTQSSNYNT